MRCADTAQTASVGFFCLLRVVGSCLLLFVLMKRAGSLRTLFRHRPHCQLWYRAARGESGKNTEKMMHGECVTMRVFFIQLIVFVWLCSGELHRIILDNLANHGLNTLD